jgi:hypothetical protein
MERAPGTQWTEGWVGPKTGVEDVEKRGMLPMYFVMATCSRRCRRRRRRYAM